MPRHTHAAPRRKHSRAHARHHRERVIAKRWRQVKRLQLGAGWAGGDPHPEAVPSGNVDPLAYSVFQRPLGELDAEQAWLGCRRAGCGLCHPPEPGRRAHEEARWRHAELHG
jgi:hypothetical protein